ncbi:hypothetical protein HZI73_18520 [Vallitalea pronyensis]|uniref:Uncharacterized protein n=1 Tax=Vallitalea pronyensis TaxID=1348613 RepID=A0A8J8SI62_9FIRM|nr:hypothetical protein [Vallitalea pronyensis]QUI24163.1 hypothetical protein HZI73_18520 [Vallitalea pronyensis]
MRSQLNPQRISMLRKLIIGGILILTFAYVFFNRYGFEKTDSKMEGDEYVMQRDFPIEEGEEIMFNDFTTKPNTFKGLLLKGAEEGAFNLSNGLLDMRTDAANSIYGVHEPNTVSGHFYAEVAFTEDDNVGLALVQEKDGQPDPTNFTSMNVTAYSNGTIAVQVSDCQEGRYNVLDNTGKLEDYSRYRVTLQNQYSVPYDSTDKKIRIFRDEGSGFFHFYYAVKLMVNGEWKHGWMELSPSKDWADEGTHYYVVPYVINGAEESAHAGFQYVRAVQKPPVDRQDTETGFKVTKRDYNWSGQSGEGLVLTFGDHFKFKDKDVKFVFWSEASYVPAWHMNNQLLYTYEFVETWAERGCYEPMSDRLGAYSSVEVLEDNDVRKVIHWRYILVNPDYKTPDHGQGTDMPQVDEYYTFYPDGTGVRHIVYTPKLDTEFRKWHELGELIVIAGTQSNPIDHIAEPGLTAMNLQGDTVNFFPGEAFDKSINNWPQVIQVAHFKDAPDAYCAWSHTQDIPDTYGGYEVSMDISWHHTGYQMVHWPVGKEPFQEDFKTMGTWQAQVAHTSLCGIEVWEDGSDLWLDHYKTNSEGRKHREWASLIGVNDPMDLEQTRNQVKSWLYPGVVKTLTEALQFESIDYYKKELVFKQTSKTDTCHFIIDPTTEDTTVQNPVFRIKGWDSEAFKMYQDDELLHPGKDYAYALTDDGLLLWIRTSFNKSSTFVVNKE